MVTRDYLEKEGFKRSTRCPLDIVEYEKEIGWRQYVFVRFYPAESEHATSLYAYSQSQLDNENTRKVVLSDTIVTEEDLQMALKICRL